MDHSFEKYVVLVPLRLNDGTEVDRSVILDFQQELFVLGGGFTLAGTVEGAYRMEDGSKQIDHSAEYWIGIPEDKVEELRRIVGVLGEALGQESMYLEHTGSKIEFVPPTCQEGTRDE